MIQDKIFGYLTASKDTIVTVRTMLHALHIPAEEGMAVIGQIPGWEPFERLFCSWEFHYLGEHELGFDTGTAMCVECGSYERTDVYYYMRRKTEKVNTLYVELDSVRMPMVEASERLGFNPQYLAGIVNGTMLFSDELKQRVKFL